MRALGQLAVIASFALAGAFLLGYNPIALLGAFFEPIVGWVWGFIEDILVGIGEWFAGLVADALNPV